MVELTQEAERLGFDSVWTAESWGSDAFTPLTWIAAHTSHATIAYTGTNVPYALFGDRLGAMKDAVQAGRCIATLRHKACGLTVPIAFMSGEAR